MIWAVIGAALAAGLLIGVTVGAWLGWPAAPLVAVLTWSRLRFRPSPGPASGSGRPRCSGAPPRCWDPWKTKGYLVLHDVTLPGWLDSLDHLVVGPTGVWVVESWRRRRLRAGDAAVPPGILRELARKAEAVAEVLDGWAEVPVRSLVCLQGAWLGTRAALKGSWSRARGNSPASSERIKAAPADVELATARLLKALRPAA